jgi:integrase
LAFIKEFEQYLLTADVFKNAKGDVVKKIKNDNNAAVKNLQILHSIVKECMSHGWIKVDPLSNTKMRYSKVEQVFLTEEEVTKIESKEILNDRLNIIRDIYIFCCYTGLAFSDVQKLNPSHISIGIDKVRYIRLSRTKTGTDCTIPLFPQALAILEKYKEHPMCQVKGTVLPVPSNQKFNVYLKEIASICNIRKNLTSHSARRAFCDMAMNNDVPAETIIKIIGHGNFNQLHRYSRTSEKKIARDIQSVYKKYQEQEPVLSLIS